MKLDVERLREIIAEEVEEYNRQLFTEESMQDLRKKLKNVDVDSSTAKKIEAEFAKLFRKSKDAGNAAAKAFVDFVDYITGDADPRSL